MLVPEPAENARKTNWTVFICYRQDDGKTIAQWLYDNLNDKTLTISGVQEEITLNVYFDQTAAAIEDWTRIHKPALESARALLMICTAGAKVDLGADDWVHKEFGWWLDNRDVAPIIIDPYDKGDRWIPDPIQARWPQPQRVLVQPDKWELLSDEERLSLERNALERLIGGLRESEHATTYEDLERERKRTKILETQRKRLIGTLALCGILFLVSLALTGIARQKTSQLEYQLEQTMAEQRLQDRMLLFIENRELPEQPYSIELLSRRYEGGSADHIGFDSNDFARSYYYGAYRIEAKTNLVRFMSFLERFDYLEIYTALNAAGGIDAAEKGDERFLSAWREVANEHGPLFAEVQKDFILTGNFERLRHRLSREYDPDTPDKSGIGLDVCERSLALQAAVFSMVVQFGPATNLPVFAMQGEEVPSSLSDAELINRLYSERDKVGTHLSGLSNERYLALIRTRNQWEKDDALFILENQHQAGSGCG